ncbi:MAG: HTTM domain-containing protein [Planctomycetota bacterium]
MNGLKWSCRLFSIDLRSLAVFRIGLASIFFCDIAFLRFPEIDAFYADGGMFSLQHAENWLSGTACWSLCLLSGSWQFQASMLGLAAGLSILMLFGWQTRIVTIGCWVMAVSIANRNPLVCNYGDTMLQVFLFWGMFLPLGAKWSLDARGLRGKRKSPICGSSVCSAASAAALLQLSFVYVFAAFWKWNADWLSGSAAEVALQLEYTRRTSALDGLIYAPLLKPLTIATLFLELLGPVIIWIPWRTQIFRYAMFIAFFLLHLCIELLFTPALLSYICVVAWALFLPSSFWNSVRIKRMFQIETEDPARALETPATQMTRFSLIRRRSVDVICLTLLLYALLWNVATLRSQQFGSIIPENLRWIGQATMLGQTWDMFSRPSKDNGWHKARARLADGSVIDVLRGGEPFEADLLESNWSYFPSSRSKYFFRRLGIMESLEPLGDPIAEYLRDDWNSQHSESQRVVELTLLYYELPTSVEPGRFTVRQTGFSMTESESDWESLLAPLDALNF